MNIQIDSRATDELRLSSYAIELKLGRMILDISPHNRSTSDFIFRFSPRGAVGPRLSKSSNRFTVYSSYPIELKFDRMIPDNRTIVQSYILRLPSRERCGGAPIEISSLTVFIPFN